MGQKINSTIFRAGLKNSDWRFKYINKNSEESSIFLYKNIEIQNYVNKICKNYNILVTNCRIEHTQSAIKILIFFYRLNNTHQKIKNDLNDKQIISSVVTKILTINSNLYFKNKIAIIKTQNLSKKFEHYIHKNRHYLFDYKATIKLFKKFLKDPLQKNLIKILFITTIEKNSAKLLADFIALYLNKNKKKHNYLFFLLKKITTNLLKLNFTKITGIKILVTGRFNGAPRAKSKTLTLGIVPLQSFNSNIDYHNSTSFTQNGTFGVKVWICEKKN